MRIVALEEHFSVPALAPRISTELTAAAGWPAQLPAHMNHAERLADLGPARIRDLDEAGIALQILSSAGPGADLLAGEPGIQFARDQNDRLARAVREHPKRFGGFAHLPLRSPGAAADELKRCVEELGFCGAMVNGTIQGRFLDAPEFEPILTAAETLAVPLYLHPGLPPESVRRAYFEGLPDQVGFVLSIAGWGWHAETALHVLRLVLAGTLERHRSLKLIIGHMGEGLPAMLARCDKVFTPLTSRYLPRTVSETLLDQLWITTSGFFDLPSFMAALLAFGADRILFSVDYPYAPNLVGRRFLDNLPVSAKDRTKIAHGNADALLRLTDEAPV
jgi:predicted TIM-barrel fold metal-dependent hydrolase